MTQIPVASFSRALSRVLESEGTYSLDPDDPGGETYCGISRRNHPGWPGWAIIDGLRPRTPPRAIPGLQKAVEVFYREAFWAPLHCDELPEPIAEELFEAAVNIGRQRPAEWLQVALNALNDRGRLWPDMTVDGQIGATTAAAAARAGDRVGAVVRLQNIQQGAHYLALCRTNDRMEKYLRGWLTRVTA